MRQESDGTISLVCDDCHTVHPTREQHSPLGAWLAARDNAGWFAERGVGPDPKSKHACRWCAHRHAITAQGGNPDDEYPRCPECKHQKHGSIGCLTQVVVIGAHINRSEIDYCPCGQEETEGRQS
jgi:hypothetical protein